MAHKNIIHLALMILLLLGISAVSNISVFAQSSSRDKSRKKEFGSSLEKFERKGKTDSKDNNQKGKKNTVPPDEETIRIDTDLVVSDVLVVNEKGNPVIGLNQSDFIIKEDAKPQKIELFFFGANASLPRSIVLIYNPHLHFRENSLHAAKALVDKLAPQDKMAIATTDLNLALDFTTDKKLLKKTLNTLTVKHPNPITDDIKEYGTLMAVLSEMFDEKDVRPIVIFQTLGTEVGQLKETDLLKLPEGALTMPELRQVRNEKSGKTASGRESIKELDKLFPERGYGFSDVLERIEKSRVTIYSIIPYMRFVGLSREEQLKRGILSREIWLTQSETDLQRINKKADEGKTDAVDAQIVQQSAMIQVAALSGGLTNFIEQSKDAEKVYDTIFTIMNNRYTIGYYSDNETRNEKPVNIKIEVRGHPEYKIIGRDSYTAPEQ